MSFNSEFSKAVLARHTNIQQVVDPGVLTAIIYSEENEKKVDAILAHGNLADLQALPLATMNNEMILIVKFFDQKNKKFFATVYDNDELWHDPTLLKVYEDPDNET